MTIHAAILSHVKDALQYALVDSIPSTDSTYASVISIGPLQGEPDPDVARISVTLHENDPDVDYGQGSTSSITSAWNDDVAEIECGAAITWRRRFTVKARCLFVLTQENKEDARLIASRIRSRIEGTLLGMRWGDVSDPETGEYVSRGVLAYSLKGDMIQGGGPPDAYDFHIKVRFEVQTTIGVIL